MESIIENRHSIAIIVCYFGILPSYIGLWLKACMNNPTVNWIVFTDQKPKNSSVKNVQFVKTSLPEIRELISEQMGFPVVFERPYKLCDYKPIYGIIFKEYLRGYDFWGYCDLDMIFGDIRTFITADILEAYDKVLWFGHLTLYRNTTEVNERYKLPGSSVDYKTAFCTEKDFAFDEVMMNEIYRHHHYPVYNQPILVDVIFYRKHYSGFRIKNYQHQVFYWEKGRVFQAYQRKGHIFHKEFLYIHFQKRSLKQYQFDAQKTGGFFISPDGFFEKKPGEINSEDFNKYNKNPGFLFEFMVMQWYFIKLRYTRLIQWIRRVLNSQ